MKYRPKSRNFNHNNITEYWETSLGGKMPGRTHGMSGTKVYLNWTKMKQRCLNKNNRSFKDYGGRGIKVCDRWLVFENFYSDMGEMPEDCECIDRINNNGDYEPDNCRWTTRKVNNNNKRSNVLITNKGVTATMAQWSEKTGIPYEILRHRVNIGVGDDRIFLKEDLREKKIAYKGASVSIKELAMMAGINYGTLSERLLKGWPVEKAIKKTAKSIREGLDKWVSGLKTRAELSSAKPYTPGSLLSSEPMICYDPSCDADEVSLDGDFTAEQLESLARHMREHKSTQLSA